MRERRVYYAAAIIAIVLAFFFVVSAPHTHDVSMPKQAATATSSTPTVALTDTYKKGVHMLSGYVMASDACMTLSALASLEGDASSSESITLALALPPDSGICLEVPTKLTFSATVTAPAGVPIVVSLNGVSVATTTP